MLSESRAVALRRLGPLLAFGLLLLVVAAAASLVPVVQRWSGDVRIFEHYAGLTFTGTLGRTPFLSWYPPAALVPIGLPLLAGIGPAYVLALAAEMSIVAIAGLALVRSAADESAMRDAPWLFALLCVVAIPLFVWRYDLVPAVLTLGAITLLSARSWGWAGVVIGLAAGMKVYAAPLGIVAIAWAWRQGGGAAARFAAGGFAASGIACAAAYLLFPPASPLDLLNFTAARPLQVESTAGAMVGFVAAVGGPPAELRYSFGSFNIFSSLADPALTAARVLQPIVVGGTLIAAVAATLRGGLSGLGGVALASLAVLLAVIVSNRVLSAQYVVWILPLVPLATGSVRRILVAAIVLTAATFPWLYDGVVALDAWPMALVVVRNALLVAAWAMTTFGLMSIAARGVTLARARGPGAV